MGIGNTKTDLQIENVKADLHTHGWPGQEPGPGQVVLKMLGETGERNLQSIAERGFREGQNTLIALVNFNDTRYQKIVNTRGDVPKGFDIYDDHVERFVGVYDKQRELWNFVLRGQEVPTDQGHLLVLGGNEEIERRVVEDVLKEAEDMGALIGGDHVLAKEPGKIFNKIGSKESERYSLGEENVRKYGKRFDFIEYGNSNVWKLTEETENFGEETGIPGFYSSDSHDLKRIFSSYRVFPELDFSDFQTLRQGIIECIESETVSHYSGGNRRLENLWHGLAVLYNIARQRIGIVKKPIYEIEY